MFFHQKTLIDTEYKCQKKKKLNMKILRKNSERYVVKQSASDKSDHVTP